MPIKPVSGMEPLPVDSPDNVAALVELMQRPGADTLGLADHLAFLAGTRPDWFRPYQELVMTEMLDRFEASVDEQGRYHSETVVFDDPPEDGEQEIYRSLEAAGGGMGAAELRPYDADLVYYNGHVQLTPGVVGTVGGPPNGLYANPSCPSCGRLMFHVASVEHHIREYGDGWRSLFLCEDCRMVSCNATGWN